MNEETFMKEERVKDTDISNRKNLGSSSWNV